MRTNDISEQEQERIERRMSRVGMEEIEDRLADGEVVEVDPEVADELGAAEDGAMSLEDAMESRFDEEEQEDG